MKNTLERPRRRGPAEKLTARSTEEKPWMRSFGKLRDLHKESARIDELIRKEFGGIAHEDL